MPLTTRPLLTWRLVFTLMCLVASTASASAQHQFEWQTATPESQGMSSAKLDALRDALAANNTHGFLVVRNDKIVCEWYAPEYSAATAHYTASMAKALVGGVSTALAITDGRIALDDKAAEYVSAWRDDPEKSVITIRQLGSHTSGLEDAEQGGLPHDKLTGWKGDFWKGGPPPNDPFTVARDKTPVVYPPGTKTGYSNPGIAMLGYCLTVAIKDGPATDLRTLLRDRVMRPIGAGDNEWSVGYRKTYPVDGLPLIGTWGGGNFTPRTTARVGRLMLRGGDWDGRPLISPSAVRQVTSDAGTPGTCGIGWWSNNEGICPKIPRDAFWGSGAGHQVMLVVPSLNLIAVRNGSAMRPEADWDKILHDGLFIPLVEAVTER